MRAREPALAGSRPPGAPAGGGQRPAVARDGQPAGLARVVGHLGRLGLSDGPSGRRRRRCHPLAARTGARRLQRHQRHDAHPRRPPVLRCLGGGRRRRLELRHAAALLQVQRAGGGRSRLSRHAGADAGGAGPGRQPALGGLLPGRGRGRAHQERGRQRAGGGGRRMERLQRRRRQAAERGRRLSHDRRAGPAESDHRH